MKRGALLLSIGAASAIAALAGPPATAQTGEAGAAEASPAPDVSRIVIRRPTGAVILPERVAAPVPLPPGAAAAEGAEDVEVAEDGIVEEDEAAGLEGLGDIEDRIIRREQPGGLAGAPAAVVPNATSADVNDPGVRIRLPGN